MSLVILEELQAFIDPLSADEHAALERSLLAEGCRDALVLWGDVLVDGHNRHAICQKHGLPFRTLQHPQLHSLQDVQLWMIDQHLGRRSVSDFQRGVLALRKKELLAQRRSQALQPATTAEADRTAEAPAALSHPAATAAEAAAAAQPPVERLDSREALARAARLSSHQVQMIEKIQQQAAPELVAAVRAGTISINAAAAVATLPAEEQAAAAQAGRDELRQAAKRVREARRKPREAASPAAVDPALADAPGTVADTALPDTLDGLRARIAELGAENAALRQQVQALQAALDAAPVR